MCRRHCVTICVYLLHSLVWLVVAVWSAVNVAGTRLRDIAPTVGTEGDPENWQKVHKDVINRCAR